MKISTQPAIYNVKTTKIRKSRKNHQVINLVSPDRAQKVSEENNFSGIFTATGAEPAAAKQVAFSP